MKMPTSNALPIKHIDGQPIPISIGLYTIDNAILKYLQTKVRPVITQDGKQIPVPIVYGNPEKWKGVQQDGMLRDKNGKIQLPIIMIRRTNMKKNTTSNPTNKYQSYSVKTRWNPRNIYDRFTVLNNVTPSQQYYSITIPDYYDVTYEAMVWTEYMEQMNRLVENISFESNEYWGEQNNFKFITTIDQFDQLNETPTSSSDRLVRTRFTINTKAYILPESSLNKDGNREHTVKLQHGVKKVIFGIETVTSL
jgi:hypothetical protein